MLSKPVSDALDQLLRAIKDTEEYNILTEVRANVDANASLKALFTEYRRLEIRARAAQLNGQTDDEAMHKLQSIGELLNEEPDGSALLFSEYKMNALMAELYQAMAQAVGIDLGIFED